jgi:ubiquinone biosynthesis protein
MRILLWRKRYRNLRRVREILHVLVQYGFEDVLSRIRLVSAVRAFRLYRLRRQAGAHAGKSRSERLRLAIEALGPGFIKLGQMLSTRYDLLPQETLDELRRLQDRIPPFPAEEARAVLAAEWGMPPERRLASFDDEPLAAASIAQVHRAVAADGRRLVLKIQRPGVAATIRADLDILRDLARLLERHIPESAPLNPSGLVDEFARWIDMELDFYREGRSTERFRADFRGDRTVRVPAVHWDLTTARVIALEHIQGIPASDFRAIEAAGLDRRVLARNGVRVALRAVFEHGFFHGDPHPGNLLVLPGHALALLDFGLTGRLDDRLAGVLGSMLSGVLDRDSDRVVRSLAQTGAIGDDADISALRADLDAYMDRVHGVPLYQLRVERLVRELLALYARHRIRLPRDFYLMGRALMVAEGVARGFDPGLDTLTLAKPFIRKALLRRLDARRFARDAVRSAEEYRELFGALPDAVRRILLKLQRNELGVNLNHQGLDRFIRELDKSTNRLSFSLIIAALIVASSLIIQIDRGPALFGMSAFGLTGYLLAGLFGLWLVAAIMRSGRL